MTCPNSPGPTAAFAATQTLLDERAAESTPKTPATSDYLLTGLVQCLSCRGAYVGVSAHGRNGIYRYYACRTRQAKGARACPGQRLPADDLEAAVIDDLLGIYDNLDLFQESIVDAYQDAEQEQPRLQAELASTDAQLRDATTAIDRYLRAFEAGTMPDSVCAPRLAELAVRRDELNANRTQLAAQLGAATPPAPNRNELQAIGSCIRAAVNEGSPDAVKQALATLIDRVEISPDRHAQPYFRVPTPDMERLGPAMARASRTPVRMEPHQVELWGIEPQASSMRPRRSTN